MAAFGAFPAAAAAGAAPLVTPPACTSKNHSKGVCCAALTTLGAARAAAGFRYTDCNGTVRCARCEIVTSTSKKHPGERVFRYRGARGCGAKGCPALGNQ